MANVREIGIIMNGVSGRMGYRQHLVRSILAIREQGGIELSDGSKVTVKPILVGRSAEKLAELAALHGIEEAAGRTRRDVNAARTLDLDLIAYGREVSEHPHVPHPRAPERLFVMGPLAEIAPDWRHPVSGLTAKELASKSTVGNDAAPL